MGAAPGTKLTGDNAFESVGDGRVRCTKTVRVTGLLVPLFRFYFGRRIPRDMFKTWRHSKARWPGGSSRQRHDRAGIRSLLSAGFWLHHAALTWRAELATRLQPLGLTPTQFIVLAATGWLEHLHGPPTQEIAEQAGADRMMPPRLSALSKT